MVTLYHSPSTAGFVVHWLLIELGIAHELRLLDLAAGEHRRPEYLAINPAGTVPALVLDGVALGESIAMVLHLADLHGLAPPPGTPARVTYYHWMAVFANTVLPGFRAWFYPTEPAGPANVDATRDGARARLEAAWPRIAAHLDARGPYLLGDTPCAADFQLTMLAQWARKMPRPATSWPALGRHAAAMKARPSYRETCAREGLTDWD